jgi:hypothetical protein
VVLDLCFYPIDGRFGLGSGVVAVDEVNAALIVRVDVKWHGFGWCGVVGCW